MNIKYVSNKSKFIDLDARRPRFMNLETVKTQMQQIGIKDVDTLLIKIMSDPIKINTAPKIAPHAAHIKDFNISYNGILWTVQGVQLSLQDAHNMLQRRSINEAESLRALALAVDIYNKTK